MALKSIKVVELAGLAPAPFCGMILAEFGATVLRIDKIGGNTNMDSLGNGKKSIALNLKKPEGIKILKNIVRKSDVLIEPFRAGVMESLGLGPEVLMQENKALIYSRLTGFGQKGPLSQKAGHDINYIALSGILSLFGRKNEKPTFPVNLAADFGGGGLICAMGILLALLERSKSGLGQVIDANMVNGSAYLSSWLFRSQNLPIWGQKRGENVLDSGAHFYEVYETKDGKFVSVGALEPQFYKELLEGLQLNEDSAFQYGDFDEMKAVFARKFREKTQKEWCDVFENLDACVMPVLSLEDAPKHENNRDFFVLNFRGDQMVPKPAPFLSRTPGVSLGDLPLPEIGQNTEEVLKTLEYSDDEINKLLSDGVIGIYKGSKL